MTSRDFCYWLQGYFEIVGVANMPISATSTEVIKKHLAMVFIHEIDPSIDGGDQNKKKKLDNVHSLEKEAIYRC